MSFIKFYFQGDIKYVLSARKENATKAIHDSVYAGKWGMLISLALPVQKLDSSLRFTNDDHYGKFSNRNLCSKHGILFSIFLELFSAFDVNETKSRQIKSYTNNEDEFLGKLPITVEVWGYFH